MSENINPILKLFQAGITREEFIKQYNDLEQKGDIDLASVFAVNSDITAEDVFDSINRYNSNPSTERDEILDEQDIEMLAKKYQNDSENGETVLSENDIAIMYHEIYANKNPQDVQAQSYNKIKQDNIFGFTNDADSSASARLLHLRYLQYQIDEIENLIETKKKKSEEKIKIYESRIDDEILKNNELDNKFKLEYKELIEQKEQKEKEIKAKEEELENLADGENPETLDTQIALLKSELHTINTQISSKRSGVSNNKIKDYERKIRLEKQACTNQVMQYEAIKDSIIQVQNIALNDITSAQNYSSSAVDTTTDISSTSTPAETTSESNENIVVTHDAEKLAQAWNSSKGTNLTTQFVQKTIDVAKNIGADANDLLALMYSESGIKSNIQNKIGATGLIQFMPATAKALGTTTDALKNMSPEQQLDYVQKFFEQNKKMAGISGDLSAGDLYALTLLPGRAGRETLTSRGEKYYSANAGLDMNGDGNITKQDLTNRIRKFIPSSARSV